MFKIIVNFSIVLFLVFSNSLTYAEECLQGRVNLLTEDGLKPARNGIPISIKKNNIEKEHLGTGSTNKFGYFCISYNNIDAGLEILFELGDPEQKIKEVWSSWIFFSPYQGISYFPNKKYQPLEIIITPAYMYSTFFKPKKPIEKKQTCEVKNGMSFVQVASPQSFEEAKIIENSLKTEYRTCILPVKVKKQNHYRVFAFPNKNMSAKKACKNIRKAYRYNCFSRP